MKKDQAAYWDKAASEKEFTTPFQMAVFKRHLPREAKILDIGCGYGRTLEELRQEGFRFGSGVDFSKEMIERGKKLFPNLDLSVGKPPFEFASASFDAVTMVAVLTCIASDDEQASLIREIRRLLKPGGVLYINDFLLNSDARNISRYNAFSKKYPTYGVFELEEGALLRHHSEDHILRLTTEFEQLEYKTLVYTTMNQHQSNGFYYLGRMP